jgi:hypothetical protein
LRRVCPRIGSRNGNLDARLQGLLPASADCAARVPGCQRPYTEFIIDCFANVHLCCIDWRGLASPGNVLRDGLDLCVRRWRNAARSVTVPTMDNDAPDACKRCPTRFAQRSNFM